MSMPRNPKNWCLSCDAKCKNSKSNLCNTCWMQKKVSEYGEKIKGDFSSNYARHRYQNIRHHAHRVVQLENREKACVACGYSNYVELCHIKSIADFSDKTKLSIINHPNNLVFLCPNHHWEQENGLLFL